MQVSTRSAQKVLHKLRFELTDCKHHVRGFFSVNGKRLFAVHVSYGLKDLPGSIQHRFRLSLKLTETEFQELMRCTIDRQKYEALLRNRGVLTQEASAFKAK
jgi:hypothetical protein